MGEDLVIKMNNLRNIELSENKIIAFVGTSKNGTSFIVNNLAQIFSAEGIKTAILDVTKNKNSFFIYTKNDENIRKVAYDCFNKLRSGKPEGIDVNSNLTVYTSVPEEKMQIADSENIISTLKQNYEIVLLDCDFDTAQDYFNKANEIYLVQSMDILTIPQLTLFLKNLKSEGALNSNKLRIIINKAMQINNVTVEEIIDRLSSYESSTMSFMTELFNKDKIKHFIIPFEKDIYVKNIEEVAYCELAIYEYSRQFIDYFKIIAEAICPAMKATPMLDMMIQEYENLKEENK